VKKRIALALSAVAFLLLVFVIIAWNAKYTVVSDTKYDSFSGVSIGYKIEQFYFWKSSRILFWNRRAPFVGTDISFDLPSLTIREVKENRWINLEKAIYLDLDATYHDSMISNVPARIIYDFHRGEIHASSRYTLWRIWNPELKSEGWMSDGEFDLLLKKLDR